MRLEMVGGRELVIHLARERQALRCSQAKEVFYNPVGRCLFLAECKLRINAILSCLSPLDLVLILRLQQSDLLSMNVRLLDRSRQTCLETLNMFLQHSSHCRHTFWA
jgi:hypothetical protein